jgi:hypothetical protein
MPVKRVASSRASRDNPPPMIVQVVKKINLSSLLDQGGKQEKHLVEVKQADEEGARVAEGHVLAAAREARASGIIQKVERPLKLGFEHTLRGVDHHHPRRAIDYTTGENQSMINRNDDLMSGPPNCMTIGFGATSKRIGTYLSSKTGKILSLSFMLIGPICSKNVIQCSTESPRKLKHLGSLTFLGCIRTRTLSWLLNSIPLLGEVDMAMSPPSTSALRVIDSVFVSWSFLLSSDWPLMTCTP